MKINPNESHGINSNPLIHPNAHTHTHQHRKEVKKIAEPTTTDVGEAYSVELTGTKADAEKMETVRPWTDEEYTQANYILLYGDDETKATIDMEAYFTEKLRRALMTVPSNQFNYIMRDFSEGIINDGFGPRIYSGYDSNIFQRLALSYSQQRDFCLNLSKDSGADKTLPEEEIESRLQHLQEQFDEAIAELAKLMQRYADEYSSAVGGSMGNQNVITDIKAYGEAIKAHIHSGNSVSGEDSAAFYQQLDSNGSTTFSLNEINKIGVNWHSKFM